jgi:hypothetical protein
MYRLQNRDDGAQQRLVKEVGDRLCPLHLGLGLLRQGGPELKNI